MAELTPMKRQYNDLKAQHPDCLLFFRLGDFYEMFDEDAKTAAEELNLTLTTRDRNKPEDQRTPMCGVPYHSAEGYIARLIAKGYKVAICEQTEDPAQAKGLVEREVIRVITRQLMFYLTIPAALIVNFSKIQEMSAQMFWVAVFGMVGNAAMLCIGFVLVRGWPRKRKLLYLFSLPGYGIGAFTLSFVQSFLSPLGNVAVCFFDMGNCILCSGACYAIIVEALSEERKGIDFKAIGKRLLTSAPLLAGVFMTVLLVLGVKLPEFVLTLIQPIANANPFISMIMLGLFFHIELKKEYLGEIA
ncbi:MAG: hypothetical protein IJO69_00445, partial [Ruminiclostridium sp.]|nr:hypothetical protein [Ruminiclostridium sp.]